MHFPIFEQFRKFKLNENAFNYFNLHFKNQIFEEDILDFIIW
jgi:hypothetical protein